MADETIAAGQLRAFIERIERLEEEKKNISDDIKDVKAEAKAMGYSVATINEIVKLRKKDEADREEAQAMLDLYMAALGMLPRDEPSVSNSVGPKGAASNSSAGNEAEEIPAQFEPSPPIPAGDGSSLSIPSSDAIEGAKIEAVGAASRLGRESGVHHLKSEQAATINSNSARASSHVLDLTGAGENPSALAPVSDFNQSEHGVTA